MVIALGITLAGKKRFLGFVETDTENEKVLTPFLRSLVERGLDVSQGLLVILDGAKGLRAAVRKAFRGRALVQRCQWHTRENVVSYLATREQVAWRQRLQRAYTRPDYDEALGALTTLQGELEERNQSAGRQPRRRPGGDRDTPSSWPVRRAGPVAQDDERPRVCQRARRGTLCEGRPLAELESTPTLAGDRADVRGRGIDVAFAQGEERLLHGLRFGDQLVARDWPAADVRIAAEAMPQAEQAPLERQGLPAKALGGRRRGQVPRAEEIAREMGPTELVMARRVRRIGRQAVAAEHPAEPGAEQPAQHVRPARGGDGVEHEGRRHQRPQPPFRPVGAVPRFVGVEHGLWVGKAPWSSS